jgi:hypothetical protein
MPEFADPPPRDTSPLATRIGLFSGADFRLATGRSPEATAIPQALWYFADETIAVPRPGVAVAGFERGVTVAQDLAHWIAKDPTGMPMDAPPLVWIGSREVVRAARLSRDGATLTAGAKSWSFAVVPKIPLNRSYYDVTSTAYLAARNLTVRGSSANGTFTARTIWPEDFRLDGSTPSQHLGATPEALRALVRAEPRGGAQSPFAALTLWERSPGAARRWEDAPVLAVILNGAQGDDDEAHGGHFALITGRVGTGGGPAGAGAINDWIVNNFYTLDMESEKGIIPAMLPLDDYLADLNSGQGWYRPSYLLVAILGQERVAARVQGALARVYNQFYRHQLVYSHAAMNCASISVDVLRALGWKVRVRGATSWAAAALGLPYFALRERSLQKAAQLFDYLTEDRTRLFPAAAFEEIGVDLLRLARGDPARAPTTFEAMLAQDLEALVFLRIPQLPSSRAWGDYPVVTTWEYRARYPRDPAQLKIVPVPSRPFPAYLRDADLMPPPRSRGEVALAVWAALSVIGIPWLLWRWWRRNSGETALALQRS